jgi:hypothetical protein
MVEGDGQRPKEGFVRSKVVGLVGLLSLSGGLWLGGCEGAGRAITPGGSAPIERATQHPPAYAEVAKGYNARVRRLEALRASADVVLDTIDDSGKPKSHQAEASLQFLRPHKVSLKISKVSNEIFLLGANGESYWWLDLSGDEKVALVGTVSKATRESGQAFGVPVHPLDFVELLGIQPLPEAMAGGAAPATRGVVRWTTDGRSVAVTMPAREGFKRLILDPSDYTPRRIELLDDVFRTVVSATHEKYQRVNVVGDAGAGAWMPSRIAIEVPANKARLDLTLFNIVNPGESKIKPMVFDMQGLIRDRDIQRVISLDERGVRRAASAPGGPR